MIKIPTRYEEIVDAKSRLKEIFDNKGWNSIQGCSLKHCIYTQALDGSDNSQFREMTKTMRNNGQDPTQQIEHYRAKIIERYYETIERNKRYGMKIDPEIAGTRKKHIVYVYACVGGTVSSKRLLSVKVGNVIKDVEKEASEEAISKLKRLGIYIVPKDPQSGNV